MWKDGKMLLRKPPLPPVFPQSEISIILLPYGTQGHAHKPHIITTFIVIIIMIIFMASLFKLSTVLTLDSAALQLYALSVCSYLLIYIFFKLGFIEHFHNFCLYYYYYYYIYFNFRKYFYN